MADIERFQSAERDFLRIAERAGLPEPDEVNYRTNADEVEVIWYEQKLAVIVELDDLTDRAGSPGCRGSRRT